MSSYGITRADKIIIVLGPTGTGKSTFIDYAIGGNGEGIGHSLISRTQEITVHKTVMGTPPQSFAFVDTPGFDDTTKPDYDVLTKIAEFLARIQNDKLNLGKLLYLHRITDNRMDSAQLKNLELFADPIVLVDTPGFGTHSDYTILGNISNWLEVHHAIDVVSILFFCQIENNRVTSSDVSTWENFKLLCGEAAMKASVTVVTTGWDCAASSNARYIDRESELRTHFWKECDFLRLERDTCSTFSTSACTILDNSVRSAPGSRLRIQTEMIHEKKPLEQTTLGQQHSQNRSTQRKLQKQVKDLVRSVRNGLILAFFRIGRLSL
ncbi:hypothetical protein FRC18_003120 [Serendipita sp. 400]|nr:hypothetical protein FRC18_003120 [Serendipita sp. 400]